MNWTSLRRLGGKFSAVALALYLPFGWVLLLDYPWNHNRLLLLLRLPVLPGFVVGFAPGPWLFGSRLPYEWEVAGLTTLLLLVGLTWLAQRSERGLFGAIVAALLVSIPSSLLAFAAFRA